MRIILRPVFQAQVYLGVHFTEEGQEDAKKAVKYLKLAADQQVCAHQGLTTIELAIVSN